MSNSEVKRLKKENMELIKIVKKLEKMSIINVKLLKEYEKALDKFGYDYKSKKLKAMLTMGNN